MSFFENSIYGGPSVVKYDDEGEEAWERAYKSVMDELEARFEQGDKSLIGLWQVFASRTKDKQRSGQFLIKAAECGDLSAQKELAEAYCYDRESMYGIKVDSEKAVYWYELVTENGSADDQSTLGYMFMNGSGALKEDLKKARYWLKKAAEKGDEDAIELLSSLREKEREKGKRKRKGK